MLLHPLTNFETQNYYQNEPKFNGVYSKNNFPSKKDGVYVINLQEYESIRTHWVVLYGIAENVTYFDSFEVKHIPKEIRKFIGNKNIINNIYRIQAYNSIMCRYFCIGLIGFMLKGLLVYTNLFPLMEYRKNNKIILKYFQ